MTRTTDRGAGDGLDDAFAALRDRAPRPSAALVGRVLADAAAVRAARVPRWRRVTARAAPALGLATAAVAGLAVGLAAPAPLADLWPWAAGEIALLPEADLVAALVEEAGP